jgi:hypothetical protein
MWQQEPIALSRKSFDLLLFLVEHRDRVTSKEELPHALSPGQFVQAAEGCGVGGFDGVGHTGEQGARLLGLAGNLHFEPAGFAAQEQIRWQAGGAGLPLVVQAAGLARTWPEYGTRKGIAVLAEAATGVGASGPGFPRID